MHVVHLNRKGEVMHCRICGRQDAKIRICELKTARLTHRAHVDCRGHGEYRSVTIGEVESAISEHVREAHTEREKR